MSLRHTYHRLATAIARAEEGLVRGFVPASRAVMKAARLCAQIAAVWIRSGVRAVWRLPRWGKWALVAVLAVLIVASQWDEYQLQRQQFNRIYASYYPYYLSVYSKQTDPGTARFYADFYARFYAEYFSSADYQRALQYALPEAKKENFVYPSTSPLAALRVSPRGLAMIKSFEGFRATPYRDFGGSLTVGYGHLIRENERFIRLSEKEAEALLIQDVRLAEAIVKRVVRVQLTQNQFDALVSLVFNIGSGQFGGSTLLAKLNRNDFLGAANEFPRWKHVDRTPVRGLMRRREAERQLFLASS